MSTLFGVTVVHVASAADVPAVALYVGFTRHLWSVVLM